MRKASEMSDDDVLAEVSDDEIDDIEERRSLLFRARAELMEKLYVIEADLAAVEEERKTWLVETREWLAREEGESEG